MKHRPLPFWTRFSGLALSLCLPCLGACSEVEAREDPADVVLIVADALRADHLGCYGATKPTSPNLDRLALESAVFDSYYTVVPTTLPSFVSLLTSRHPREHGSSRNGVSPVEGLDNLGAAFQQAGYETAFFVSSYCLSERFGTSVGFDHFDDELDQERSLTWNKLIRSAESVTQAFLDWREQREPGRPYFAVVHYFDPHWPYIPPLEYAAVFVEDVTSLESLEFRLNRLRERLEAEEGEPTDLARLYHDLYLAEIRYMDHEIGRIIERIDTSDAAGSFTILGFTADHGETFWEHEDYFNHGYSVYDTNIKIPLLLRAPGLVEPGRYVEPRFSNLDLGPTLLGLANAPVPAGFNGRNLRDVLDLGSPPRGTSFVFAEGTKPHETEDGAMRPNLPNAKCIIEGPWKLIWTPWQEDREELYNLELDPGEENDLAGEPSFERRIERLRERLQAWALDTPALRGTEDTSPEVKKSLKALGYGE